MTSEFDTLARLVAYHDHIAMPHVPVDDDVRRGRRRVRRNRGLAVGGTALGLASLVMVASLVAGDGSPDRPQPADPTPTETTPTEITTPATAVGWPGAVRRGTPWPVETMETAAQTVVVRSDAKDASVGAIDIREVRVHNSRPGGHMNWTLFFREPYPQPSELDEADRVIEYGVVVDSDRDRVADCQIGLNNDAGSGEFRVWVKNLRTGATDERVGPPYGDPVDFVHPTEESETQPRIVVLFFVTGTSPAPCDAFQSGSSFYAWSVALDGGEATAWDFAPDAAWLEMPH